MGLDDMRPPRTRPAAGGRVAAKEWAGRAPPWRRLGSCGRLAREEKGLEDMCPPGTRPAATGRPAAGEQAGGRNEEI
jgi:hypothetical protein